MVQTPEEKRAKRAADAAKEGRSIRSYKRRTDAVPTPPAQPAPPAPDAPIEAPPMPPPLPGGFAVGDCLVYTGKTRTVTVYSVPGGSVLVKEGTPCKVTGPAKDPSKRHNAVSVRFHHHSRSLGTSYFTVDISTLRYPRPSDRLCDEVEERIQDRWPSVGYVEKRLRAHGFVDGSLCITSREDYMQREAGRLRRNSI